MVWIYFCCRIFMISLTFNNVRPLPTGIWISPFSVRHFSHPVGSPTCTNCQSAVSSGSKSFASHKVLLRHPDPDPPWWWNTENIITPKCWYLGRHISIAIVQLVINRILIPYNLEIIQKYRLTPASIVNISISKLSMIFQTIRNVRSAKTRFIPK